MDYKLKHYGTQLLIFGLFITGFGIYMYSNHLISKSQLTEIKGVLFSANTHVSTVTSKTRGTTSRKSELIIYLEGRQQKFKLVENIGKEYRNDKFENIKKTLYRADSVVIWVRKKEIETYEPKVFQIDADDKTILEFEDVRSKDSGLSLFFLFLGLGSLTFLFGTLYPKKFRKIIRKI